ncbi:MAG: SMP-30/gluconolactonase/LRE family protein [Salinibacter sp.]
MKTACSGCFVGLPDLIGGPRDRGWMLAALIGLLVGMCGADAAVAQEGPVPSGATVELVDDGFEFTEGPVWHNGALLFSDIPANTIYRWTPEEGTRVFMNPSGHANGLAVDSSGGLLLAQHDGAVAHHGADGSTTTLVQSYGGKRLNSPNDLTVASDGTIYFTDPPYGVDEENRELSFSGVYRLSPNGQLTLLTKGLSRPNGIVLSPDESTLYVNDSGQNIIRAYDVTEDGGIENGRQFAAPTDPDADGSTDGMTVDRNGNLYTTGPGGIWVYAPDGTQLARIAVPKAPTNVTFGGPDRTTLYITARPHVYRVPVNVPGAR